MNYRRCGQSCLPCGYTLVPDCGILRIYYGTADTSIAGATGSVKAMLAWLKEQGY